MTTARVILWGSDIGAVTWIPERGVGVFQYTREFAQTSFEVAPVKMPLSDQPYEFPELPHEAFRGLPGMLADSLPDKFGNAMINAWLSTQGRDEASFNPVERLCYIGDRGMGALEFLPTIGVNSRRSKKVDVAALVDLANRVINERGKLHGFLNDDNDKADIEDIIRVGTSPGGARAKAVLAWNEETNEFRSGQVQAEKAFTHWLIKFDGIDKNKDKELADPKGYGLIEYAYHLMAAEAGISMERCRIHYEGGRAHFMTKRFDRTGDGDKLHMQTLGAIMHYDYNQSALYSYEQAVLAMNQLNLSMSDVEEQFRRAAFNIIGRNQDDHVKNISFLMDRDGIWSLSPGYDIAYSYNPSGSWTSIHQMSVNGKRDGFDIDDLIALASVGNIKKTKAKKIVEQVDAAIASWAKHAETAGVLDDAIGPIQKTFRRNILVG